MKHYYNTTDEKGRMLEKYQQKAISQEEMIAFIFEQRADDALTPWEIINLFPFPKPPITSIRRGITNLTLQGILKKTDILKEVGSYGRRSYAWSLSDGYKGSIRAMNDIIDQPERKPVNEPKNSLKQGVLFQDPALQPSVSCRMCGRTLTNQDSIEKGIGPVCAKGTGCNIKYK